MRDDRCGAWARGMQAALLALLLMAGGVATLSAKDEVFDGYGQRIAALVREARYAEAMQLAEEMAKAAREQRGEVSIAHGSAITWIGYLRQVKGEADEARKLLEQAVEIYRKVAPPDRSATAKALNNLGLATAATGDLDKAEALYREAQELHETDTADPAALADTLVNLSHVMRRDGRLVEAGGLLQRAIRLRETHLGAKHPLLASGYQALASLHEQRGAHVEAEEVLRKALQIRRATQDKLHPELTGLINRLAENLYLQGKNREADPLFREAIEQRERSPATNPLDHEATLKAHGLNLIELGQPVEAERILRRCIEIRQSALGPTHASLASRRDGLAEAIYRQKKFASAAGEGRRVLRLLPESGALDDAQRRYLERFLKMAWALHQELPADKRGEVAAEALAVAQRATQTATTAAVARMGARFAATDAALADLIKALDDVSRSEAAVDRELLAALSLDAGQRQGRDASLRAELQNLRKRRSAISNQLQERYPAFARLINPAPVGAAALAPLIERDEAALLLFAGREDMHGFLVTGGQLHWQMLAADPRTVRQNAQRLGSMLEAAARTPAVPFETKVAVQLHEALIKPFEPRLKGVTHLIVVPTGPLTSLPFQALARRIPDARLVSGSAEAYRQTDWIVRHYAVSVQPSLDSIRSLRTAPAATRERLQLVGFANPRFGDAARAPPSTTGRTRGAPLQLAYSSFWRGAAVDPKSFASLSPLPETELELQAVAAALGARSEDLHVGRTATETRVKSLDLARYRVVYFATHGLIAGEAPGLGEPGLVLSVPDTPSAADDGLLTASEIAQLKLDADWVVLSACNTAAGGGQGAEGLSGLAKAFFHAGARALLVSHWSVDTTSAARLGATTFLNQSKKPGIRRAEALRQAMLEMLDDDKDPGNAHPVSWAPFAVVGEGGR